MRTRFLLIALVAFSGCDVPVEPEYKPKAWVFHSPDARHESTQTCLMCGKQYIVASNNPVPATVEWCFDDGQICQIGRDLMVQGANHLMNNHEDGAKAIDIALIKHCSECVGCKCAFFNTPEKWSKAWQSVQTSL